MYLYGSIATPEDDSFAFIINVDGGDNFWEVVGDDWKGSQGGIVDNIYPRKISGHNGSSIVGKRLVTVDVTGLCPRIDSGTFGYFFTRNGMVDG